MGRLGQWIVMCMVVVMLASAIPVAAAAQTRAAIVPPDLAAMVLTPADLVSAGADGFRRGQGEEGWIGLQAGAMSAGTGIPEDDILAVLEGAGWQRQYVLPLRLLADIEDSDSVLRTVRSTVTAYESTEGAAQAFAFLEDESVASRPELFQDLESIPNGVESELTVEYYEDPQRGIVPIALSYTFRTGAYVAEIEILVPVAPVRGSVYETLDPTSGSADIVTLESAAIIMLGKIGDVSALGDPQPGVLALRYGVDAAAADSDGEVVVIEADSAYSLYGGEPVPGSGWTDAEIDESRTTAQAEGRLHSYSRFNLVTYGGMDLAWTWAIVERYVDDSAAQVALDGKLAGYTDRDNFQELAGIPDHGDDMVALSFTITGNNGDVRTAYRIFTRIGTDIVATFFFPVEYELPVDPALALLEAQFQCYNTGSCLEQALFPAELFMADQTDAPVADTTPESSTTYAPASQDEPDDAEEQGTAEDVDVEKAPEPEASDEVESGFYESPHYGYTLGWDPDTWQVVIIADDPDDEYDLLYLQNDLSLVGLIGDPDYDDGDLETCIEDYTTIFEDDEKVSEVDEMRGRRNRGSDDERRWVTYTYLYDGEERVRYYECRAMDDDGVTLVILHDAAEDDYDDEIDAREDLLEGVEF